MSVASANITPMMAQFLDIKKDHKNALLFYRMGDFYEMFFDDAVLASAALGITLTKRGKHKGVDIPMCGVPAHSSENYLLSLIRKGFRVAVCEQLENPAEAKKRGAKSVVKRGVVRLVTPGTLTEDTLLESSKNNYLASYITVRDEGSLAWVDMSTGQISVMRCPLPLLSPQLARLGPSEVIISDDDQEDYRSLIEDCGAAVTTLSKSSFDSASSQRRLCEFYQVQSLDAFGAFDRADLSALGAIIEYLDLTQKGNLPKLRPPVLESFRTTMQIDAATRRNLELTQTLDGGRDGAMLAIIDRTVTGAGARLLANRLGGPSTDLNVIAERADCVDFFVNDPGLGDSLRAKLRNTPDLDRSLSRLVLSRGGPRDLAAIRTGLHQARLISEELKVPDVPTALVSASGDLIGFELLSKLLQTALVSEPPLLARDGGLVDKGYDDELDQVRILRDQGRAVIATMQTELIDLSGIKALKIKHNNVLGYFVETQASHADKMLSAPLSDLFIHRQTTASAARFTTLALSELETRIHNAAGRAIEIELRIFAELQNEVVDMAAEINAAATALAEFDWAAALAHLAVSESWCRPKVEAGQAFDIQLGRHPVVESALQAAGQVPFVANSCDLTPKSEFSACIWLLTGPNMAGKSTFLRQNALIAILAQMGSYVPAQSATIGVVNQLFSRVGASDDLARGRSTFMVEMVETAAILNQAEGSALVILDEIGRGTATYDGLSIAWATLEYLHDVNKCRAIFATHYHELTALSSTMVNLSNATVAVKEWQGEVIFLHEVIKGAADRSYGVQVAKLAGLPEAVVNRAHEVLAALEDKERKSGGSVRLINDLPLFSATPNPATATAQVSAVEDRLLDTQPDDLSPKDALNLIYELRDLLKD